MDPRIHKLPVSRVEIGKKKIVNRCPVCPDGQLDERGYCRHLVGFTYDGIEYEPRKMFRAVEGGNRYERTIGVAYGTPVSTVPESDDEDDLSKSGDEYTGRNTVPRLEKVLPTDIIRPGQSETTPTRRVYRLRPGEVPKAVAPAGGPADSVNELILEQVARLSQKVEELEAERKLAEV